MQEFDALGRDAFLAKYGFGRSRRFFLRDGERTYDSKAIVGAAFGYQHPERGPLTSDAFAGGEATVKPRLEGLGFVVVEDGEPATRVARAWWVNQGLTFDQERAGGYVWAPQRAKNGQVLAHHAAVAELRTGDLVLHYAKGFVRAASVVRGNAREESRPSELPEDRWDREGYLAPVDYHEAPSPIALEELPAAWRTADGGPFTRHGGVKQGYLFPVSPRFVARFTSEFVGRWPELPSLARGLAAADDGMSEFLSWGQRFFEWSGFEREERTGKLEIAEELAGVRQMLGDGQDWRPAFRATFDSGEQPAHLASGGKARRLDAGRSVG